MPINLGLLRQESIGFLDLDNSIMDRSDFLSYQLEINQSPGIIEFKVNGELRWIIDEKFFTGNPKLNVISENNTHLKIELKGAYFLVTNISADFVCILDKIDSLGHQMNLKMNIGGFETKVNFEEWLEGKVSARSLIKINSLASSLGKDGKILIRGRGEGFFFPNWKLEINGEKIISVKAPSLGSLIANHIMISLLSSQDPSMITSPMLKRTLLTIPRKNQNWNIKPKPDVLSIGSLNIQENSFDIINIETGENSLGKKGQILTASSYDSENIILKVKGKIKDLDGNQFRLLLVRPRYVIDFETMEKVFLSHFHHDPQWLCIGGFAIQIADILEHPSFEVVSIYDSVTELHCQPLLTKVIPPLTGNLVSEPIQLNDKKSLSFVSEVGGSPGWGILASSANSDKPYLSLPTFAVRILRPQDLLSLDFFFFNLALEAKEDEIPYLIRIDPTKDAFISVQFNSPQSIAEQVLPENIDPLPLPVSALASGPSRLVFSLKKDVNSIEYTIENLLQWQNFESSLAPVVIPSELFPLKPTITETAIESPWHLFISPLSDGGWKHEISSVKHEEYTELWHSRLGVKKLNDKGDIVIDEKDVAKIRAIWSTDFSTTPPIDDPFLMPITAEDRIQIVNLSSNFSLASPPKTIDVFRLMLSSLGSWMNIRGNWEENYGSEFTLKEWSHRSTMARDHYVKIVYKGYLLPFGHKASLVKETERKVKNNPSGNSTAYLYQRFYIVVNEPEKDYRYLETIGRYQGRDFVYKAVEITTIITPTLDPPPNDKNYFFPTINGEKFHFSIIGTDREGQTSEFMTPIMFLKQGSTTFTDTDSLEGAVNEYQQSDFSIRRRDLSGQLIAYTKSKGLNEDTTSFPTSKLTFSVENLIDQVENQPSFYPILDQDQVNNGGNGAAEIIIPTIERVTGKTMEELTAGKSAIPIKFYEQYLANDLQGGEIFVEFLDPLFVRFSENMADKVGGIATPDLAVIGLSRTFGNVSGTRDALKDFVEGNFDPKNYFGPIIEEAKLLGAIKLAEIIKCLQNIMDKVEKIPRIITLNYPTVIETIIEWKPDVQNLPGDIISLDFTNLSNESNLTLTVKIITELFAQNPPQVTIKGELKEFSINLVKAIVVNFKYISFTKELGKKIDIKVDLKDPPIEFFGDLRFINQLKDLIPFGGFNDGPNVNIIPDGLRLGYSLPFPSITLGAFSLENIRLSASFDLPFSNKPIMFRFAFSERHDPFIITVSMLGGGGFFGLAVGSAGIEMLEAALEFGAHAAINLARIARGSLHIMAGIYLRIESPNNKISLTGYLIAYGRLEVLGLITVSVEFYLGLTYFHGNPTRIYGEATIRIEIDTFLFSKTVSVKLTREFADPKVSFQDLISKNDWEEYCEAFVPILGAQ